MGNGRKVGNITGFKIGSLPIYLKKHYLQKRLDGLTEIKCDSCKKILTEKKMIIDHSHSSGEIRGILCQRCNIMIGLSGDDPAILERAINYLKKIIPFGCPVCSGTGKV